MTTDQKRSSRARLKLKNGENTWVQRSTLSNGIRVVTENIPDAISLSVGMWITAGSRDERPENNGVSHLLEHMLFKGTRNRTTFEIAAALEDVGGGLNAFTGKELSCYYAHVLASDAMLAIDVLSDMLTQPLLAPEEIRKEKHVILEEIASSEEIPEERIFDYFQRDFFGAHPLALTTLGTRRSLGRLGRKSLTDYMRQHYTADRLVVSAAGSADHDAICRFVESRFADWPKSGNRSLSRPDGFFSPRHIDYFEDCKQAQVCSGTRAFSYQDDRVYPALLLNTLLGGGMSSILFQALREEHGLCYTIHSDIEFLQDSGIFSVYFATDHSNVDFALQLVREEFDRLRQDGFSQYDIDRTKSQIKGNVLLDLESYSNRMSQNAKMEIYLKDYMSFSEINARIDAVTRADVAALAEELLIPEQFVTTVLRAKES